MCVCARMQVSSQRGVSWTVSYVHINKLFEARANMRAVSQRFSTGSWTDRESRILYPIFVESNGASVSVLGNIFSYSPTRYARQCAVNQIHFAHLIRRAWSFLFFECEVTMPRRLCSFNEKVHSSLRVSVLYFFHF